MTDEKISEELTDEQKQDARDVWVCMMETQFRANDGDIDPEVLKTLHGNIQYEPHMRSVYEDRESLGELMANCPNVKTANPDSLKK